ncbi:MAG: UDP-N-acetylmuramoyl-L-alanyl-D-glutamate--2,6-diaminopimelate ligase [Ignavibacteriaceae bacterium]|nr:UDP-N-acetylmuramoyl-L-alanyl-D-glutamate--2,6-diaminopimelate ligase [Ignavibacteriaceae bacterium]
MELTDLINKIYISQIVGEVQRQDVTGIFYDSRNVTKGSVFVAIKGFKTDGHKFILDALNNGAIAVILEDNNSVPDEIFIHNRKAKILVKDSRIALAQASNYFFKEPSGSLNLIGITGTNGKTTTSYFIKSIVEQAGNKTGLIGTISNFIGSKEIKTFLTTPESNDLNALLYEMLNEGCSYTVMEVSSHSLVLKRVYGLKFSTAVFTNITSDHLDFHGNFEEYFKAKKILFDSLSDSANLVYNIDDKSSVNIIKDSKAKIYSYGTQDADFQISNISYDLSGTTFIIRYKSHDFSISTSLVGSFNAYNAAAAFASAVLNGINPEIAIKGIKNTKQVPGRFEVVGKGSKKVIIDYSHTADSLEKALSALNNIVEDKYPVYTVFGCGGNRDKTKRPVMGRIASELSRRIFITSDNPRNENPLDIINEIKSGIKKENFEVIENREEAIRKSIEETEKNAIILIAGKGHESYQEINGIRNHFSDKEVAEKYLSHDQN